MKNKWDDTKCYINSKHCKNACLLGIISLIYKIMAYDEIISKDQLNANITSSPDLSSSRSLILPFSYRHTLGKSLGWKEGGKEGNLTHTAEYKDNTHNPSTTPTMKKWTYFSWCSGSFFSRVNIHNKSKSLCFCFNTILKSPYTSKISLFFVVTY